MKPPTSFRSFVGEGVCVESPLLKPAGLLLLKLACPGRTLLGSVGWSESQSRGINSSSFSPLKTDYSASRTPEQRCLCWALRSFICLIRGPEVRLVRLLQALGRAGSCWRASFPKYRNSTTRAPRTGGLGVIVSSHNTSVCTAQRHGAFRR